MSQGRNEVAQPERVQRVGLINLPQTKKRIKNSPQGLPPNDLEERKNESLTIPLRRDILGKMSLVYSHVDSSKQEISTLLSLIMSNCQD